MKNLFQVFSLLVLVVGCGRVDDGAGKVAAGTGVATVGSLVCGVSYTTAGNFDRDGNLIEEGGKTVVPNAPHLIQKSAIKRGAASVETPEFPVGSRFSYLASLSVDGSIYIKMTCGNSGLTGSAAAIGKTVTGSIRCSELSLREDILFGDQKTREAREGSKDPWNVGEIQVHCRIQ